MHETNDVHETNIFEKIISREIPADIIYEDDMVIAFLDIKPVNKGHALVVPKKKFRNMFDADPEYFAHMAKIALKVVAALKVVTSMDGANLVMNNERAGGQDVFHAHMHVIPRFEHDDAFRPAQHTMYTEGEMATFGAALRKVLS